MLMRTEKIISVKDKTPPSISTTVMAVLITVVLSIGFTFMYGTAIGIEFNIPSALVLALITSVVFAVIHFQNKRYLSIGAFITAPALSILMLIFDWFKVKQGLFGFLYFIQLYAFFWFPGYYPDPTDPEVTVFAFLAAYNLIAISVTTFLLMRREFIPLALLYYSPLFLLSVQNTTMRPSQWTCLVSAAGVFLLVLTHIFRNKKQETAERIIMILSVPLVALTLLTGLIFPEKKYKQDDLAIKLLSSIQERIDRTGPLGEMLDKALYGFRNSNAKGEYDSFSPLYATTTNLNYIGPFRPPQTEVLKVLKSKNPDYSGNFAAFDSNDVYLKIESFDKYEDNKLSSTSIWSKPYNSDYDPVYVDAPYGITVTPLRSSAVDIVPYYTDFYHLRTASHTSVNPYNTTRDKTFYYASSPLPVKTGNIYSEAYLENYVYKEALKVPHATESALTMSGKLPEWYMEVYMGHIEMSDADKVRGVTEFVRNLHPYDKDTDYPPEEVDFVPWFVSEGETGICVHYAATTMILLRMIGVPARYVRGYIDTRSYNNTESTVYASQAHAWFEFFVPEYGWIMGDSTPGYEKEAAHFNIDAVSRLYPEIENAPFSIDNYKNATFDEPLVSIGTVETTGSSDEPTFETELIGATPTPTAVPGMNITESSSPSDTRQTDTQDQQRGQTAKNNIFEENAELIKKILTVIVIVAASIFALIGSVRLAFVLFWRNKFSTANINDKAVSYYHYFRLMGKIFNFSMPGKAKEIAEKAVFSGDGITGKEIKMLITVCNEQMMACSKGFSRIKMYFYMLLRLKIR